MTYNANLDKSLLQRKPLAELRAELKRWEELHRVNAKKRERDSEVGVGDDAVGYQVCMRFVDWIFFLFPFLHFGFVWG